MKEIQKYDSLDDKNLIVVEQKITYDFKYAFNYLKDNQKKDHDNSKFTIKGRVDFIFPQLERYGIKNYDEFLIELEAVLEKRSTKSATCRELIKNCYWHCYNYLNQIK